MPGSFEDLEVYREAREFRKRIYKLARLLPPEEKTDPAPQMRHAAVSLTNNIAEGEGRWNRQDAIRFHRIARGSLFELLDDINVCSDERYAEERHLADLREHGYRVRRLLDGYIRYLNTRKQKADAERRVARRPSNRGTESPNDRAGERRAAERWSDRVTD